MNLHRAPRDRVAAAAGGVVALLAGLTLTVTSTPPADATGGPFTCTPGFFQVTSGLLNKLDPVTGVYTPVGSAYSDTYNAMGYDTLNNYLYAIDTSAGANKGDLLRIADDGSVTNLGTPSGYPAGTTSVAGDFDATGDLIVQDSATAYYSIDVATMTATKLTITGSTQAVDDLVWVGGYMYGMSGTSTVDLLVVDLSTGVATQHAVSGITSTDGAFGAGFSDQPNDLFFSDNSGAGIYSLSGYATSSPSATYEAPGAVTGNNDGAACKLAGSPFAGPTANPDSYSPLAGQAFSVDAAEGVLANDTGSEPLTVASHTGPSHGTLTLNSDGSFTYTPTGSYSGPDSFTYVAEDPYGRTSSAATVSLTVIPNPQNQTDTTALNTAYTQAAPGLLTGAVGSSLTLVSNTNPAQGTVSVTDLTGVFTYTPQHDWSGVDTFTYTVMDLYDQTATATVTMDVPPSVQPDSYTANGTTPLAVVAPGVLSNDIGTGLTVTSHTTPGHGTVSTGANGSFTYTAGTGFSGTDTFQYTATDSSGLTGTATVTIQVTPASGSPGYTTPADTALNIAAAQGVVAASDGSGLTATETAGPSDGSLSLSADGAFTYTPNAGYSGEDGFSFQVTDNHGQQASGTASIVVTPVANPDSGTTPFRTPLSVAAPGVLGNDVGTGLTVTGHTIPAHGTVTVNADGSYVYTPNAGYVGTDSFQYTLEDQAASTATATVTITVTQAATSFTASADPTTTTYGHTIQLTASGLPSSATGTVTFAAGGSTLCTTGPLSAGSASCTTAVPAVGSYAVTATYSGDSDYQGSTATTGFTITTDPVLQLSTSGTPSAAAVGTSYSLTLTSSLGSAGGPADSDPVLTATLPSGEIFAAAPTVTGWSCGLAGGGHVLICTSSVAPIPAGTQLAGITAMVDIAATGSLETTASLADSADLATAATATATVDVTATPTLVLSTSGTPSAAAAGTSYELTLRSALDGPPAGAAYDDPTLFATLPGGETFAAAPSATGWSCSLSAGATVITCAPTVAPTAPGTAFPDVTATVDIAASASGSLQTIAALADDGDGATTVSTTATLQVTSPPVLDVTTSGTPATAPAGAVYTLNVDVALSSAGGPAYNEPTVTLVLPTGETFTAAPNVPGWDCALSAGGTTLTCTSEAATPIDPGTQLVSLSVQVQVGSGATGELITTVSAGDAADGATLAETAARVGIPVATPATGARPPVPTLWWLGVLLTTAGFLVILGTERRRRRRGAPDLGA